MPNIGMRAGTEAARIYEEKRTRGRRQNQVTEVKYGSMIRFIIRAIYHVLLVLLIPGAYLLWDAITSPDEGSGVTIEILIVYVLIVIYFIYFNQKIKRYCVKRTANGLTYTTITGKREISYDDLIYGARRQPVKQVDNGWVFATSKKDITIITNDMVDYGFEFCMQLCVDLRISRPQIRNTTRRRYLRGYGSLVLMFPFIFLHLAYWSSKYGTNGATEYLILAAVLGTISLGMIVTSYLIDK